MQFIPQYQDRANGIKETPSIHPEYDLITKDTFGIMIYQEQIMMIAQRMGGYSKGEADLLRKAVGKKKKALLDEALGELRSRMLQRGHPEDLTNSIIKLIEPFAGYGLTKNKVA